MKLQQEISKEELLILYEKLQKKNDILVSKTEQFESKTKQFELKTEHLESQKMSLEFKVENLQFQIKQLERMRYGSKRERFESKHDPNQLSLNFDIEETKLEEAIETDKQKISYERSKPKKKHPGRTKLPPHLPVKEIILEPTEDVSGMTYIGDEITEELEYTPAKLYIKRYIRPKYISKEDEQANQHQVIAELNRPIPKCIAGPKLLANIFVEKIIYHMPLHRQLKRFAQNDIYIHANTFDSWGALTSKLIRPLYAVHKTYILNEFYLQVDESPIKVLDKDKKGTTHQGYMWVYFTPMRGALFFEYKKGRSASAPKENLENFKGFLQTDGYAVYNEYGKKDTVVHLSCMAHARRYFEKALQNDYEKAAYVLEFIQQLYAIERYARENNLPAEKRYALRLEKALPILNEMGKYIMENNKKVLPQSPIGKAFEYCMCRWDNLMNYLQDGNLEIDNNLIENSIRPLALGRKNYLFAGSHQGAENLAMFYSFFGTCKKHDINPEKWLAYVIENINDTKISQLKNLLPQFIDKSLIS
ncbi:MAG: IS66 family transposase [Bacteroidales bacterium]|jgi:transposase|nr:IS66 family transposase [Bacteroidales bacterium]